MPRQFPLSAIFAALVLAGCTTPSTPSMPAHVPAAPASGKPVTPPPAPVDTRPATIKGSEESSTLLDNFTAFITAIDGQPVSAGRKGWAEPLSLAPGPHKLTVEFNRGSFLGRTELALEAKPGAAYELRQVNDAQVYGDHSFCEFWIVDLATGEKVVPAKRIPLEKIKGV